MQGERKRRTLATGDAAIDSNTRCLRHVSPRALGVSVSVSGCHAARSGGRAWRTSRSVGSRSYGAESEARFNQPASVRFLALGYL
jgi:hypothetical protein